MTCLKKGHSSRQDAKSQRILNKTKEKWGNQILPGDWQVIVTLKNGGL